MPKFSCGAPGVYRGSGATTLGVHLRSLFSPLFTPTVSNIECGNIMATTKALHNLHREPLETIEEVGTRRLDLPKEEMPKHTREKGDGARRLP